MRRRGLVLLISAASVFATAARTTAGERQTALHNGWIATPGTSSRAVEAPSAVSVTRTYIYPKGSYRWFSVQCGPNPSGWGGTVCEAMWVDPDLGVWALHVKPRTWASGSESVRSEHFEDYARRRTLRLWDVPAWGERFASTRRAAGTSTEGKGSPHKPEGRKEWVPVSYGLLRERVPSIRDRPLTVAGPSRDSRPGRRNEGR